MHNSISSNTEALKNTISDVNIRVLVIITLLFITAACTSTPEIEIPEEIAAMENVAVFAGDAAPLHEIRLNRAAEFGDTDELFIGWPSGIAVADEGALFMADAGEAKIHIYSAEGEYLQSLGRRGEGPGEFNSVFQLRLHNGELYALDTQQQRLSVFDASDFSFLRNISLGGGSMDVSGFPVGFEPLTDGRFLATYNRMVRDGDRLHRTPLLKIMDKNGEEIASDIVDLTPAEMFMIQSETTIQMMSLPFMRESHFVIDGDENLVWGYTGQILLQFVSLEGEYLRSIYYSRPNPPLDRAAMLANFEDDAVRESVRALDIPETSPAFRSFLVDDENRIWITLYTENEQENEIWVLDEEGEKLAEFKQPAVNQLQHVKKSHAYFLEVEEETGLQKIVKYGIELI